MAASAVAARQSCIKSHFADELAFINILFNPILKGQSKSPLFMVVTFRLTGGLRLIVHDESSVSRSQAGQLARWKGIRGSISKFFKGKMCSNHELQNDMFVLIQTDYKVRSGSDIGPRVETSLFTPDFRNPG